jgi:hypothetical protein
VRLGELNDGLEALNIEAAALQTTIADSVQKILERGTADCN